MSNNGTEVLEDQPKPATQHVHANGPFQLHAVHEEDGTNVTIVHQAGAKIMQAKVLDSDLRTQMAGTLNLAASHFDVSQVVLGGLRIAAQSVHQLAIDKGWWENDDQSVDKDLSKIMLMVCELAEAVEGLRDGAPKSTKIPAFLLVEEELADAVIRIMDLAERRGWRLAEALVAKHMYNKSRPHRHGGKLA